MTIGWHSWAVWGFASTVLLTSLMAVSQGVGLTRMNIPYLLGTMFTAGRDRAKLLGVGLHLVNGMVFALGYVVVFAAWGGPTWWKGALIGAAHALFVLAAGMPVLPALHPRMASETRGPTVVRQLEPPGFLGLHYGFQTPTSIVIAHVVFGILLGVLYKT